MSSVTDFILTTGVIEYKAVAELNKLLSKDEYTYRTFNAIDTERAGGNKYHTVDIYTMAWNYADLDEITEIIRAVNWSDPKSVSLFVRQSNDEYGMREIRWYDPKQKYGEEGSFEEDDVLTRRIIDKRKVFIDSKKSARR